MIESLGFDLASLQSIEKRLSLLSLSRFGRGGPWSERVANEFKPDATAIAEAPVPVSAHAALFVVLALLVTAIVWAIVGRVDRIGSPNTTIHAQAEGRRKAAGVTPSQRAKARVKL